LLGQDSPVFRKHEKGLPMSYDTSIKIENLGKQYRIYPKPNERLRQSLYQHLQNFIGKPHGQYFRQFQALGDVAFEVKKGEAVGIIGRNGSGKSTLLQLICGTLTPSNGNIEINGRIAALLELGAGFNPEFTGRENIYMNASILGLSKKEIDKIFSDIVSFADIGDFIEQQVKVYSNGMYLRLAFSTAINVSPDILIIDELLAVGDIRFQQKCFRKIEELKAKKITILLASHDMNSIINYCDRAVWLKDGHIFSDGLPKDVCEKYITYMNYDALTIEKQTVQKNCNCGDAESPQSIEWEPVHSFDSFGKGGVIIEKMCLCTKTTRRKLKLLQGGEKALFLMEVLIRQNIDAPLVGFLLRDNYGNNIIGMNNELYNIALQPLQKDRRVIIEFEFDFPLIRNGFYTFSAAVAEGTKESHTQHHWVHDAYIVQVANQSKPADSGCYFILESPTVKIVVI
jgi:ABC-type polysaccharide/polyol phosphate transport system ATPase subunit